MLTIVEKLRLSFKMCQISKRGFFFFHIFWSIIIVYIATIDMTFYWPWRGAGRTMSLVGCFCSSVFTLDYTSTKGHGFLNLVTSNKAPWWRAEIIKFTILSTYIRLISVIKSRWHLAHKWSAKWPFYPIIHRICKLLKWVWLVPGDAHGAGQPQVWLALG